MHYTDGRGVNSDGSDISPGWISNSTISDNFVRSSYYDGGGIRAEDTVITGNLIVSNLAEGDGGGVYAEDSIVGNNVVTENSGEGIYAIDSTITDNIVTNNSRSGIYSYSGTVTSNIVSGNRGMAGIHAYCSTIEANTVVGNESSGIYALDDIYNDDCNNVRVAYNEVLNNSAVKGGGLFVYNGCTDGTTVVIDNIISGNQAEDDGGGIYACAEYRSGGWVKILNNIITAILSRFLLTYVGI